MAEFLVNAIRFLISLRGELHIGHPIASGWPAGMLGGLAKSEISCQWIHPLAAVAANPFLTTLGFLMV